MKLNTTSKSIILGFMVLSSLLIYSNSKKGKFSKKNLKQIGGIPGILPPNDAVAYGYAGEKNYVLQNLAGFVSPTLMAKIPIYLNNPYTGIMTEANGYIPNKFYYNGADNISAVHVNCNIYSSDPQGCVHNSSCGWCGERGVCIAGSLRGPLAPCLRSTFLYQAPDASWNPLKAGVVNVFAVDRKGVPQLHLTGEPDLKKIDVYSPYR